MVKVQDLVAKGELLLKDGKFDGALDLFEQALLLHQDDSNLWNNKGIALRSLGRYEEAIECFNKSLRIDPRDRNAS